MDKKRMMDTMASLHDDLLTKINSLKEKATQAAAKGTQLEQNFTDVSARLDEVNKILDDFLNDDASQGSSTGGDDPNKIASPPNAAVTKGSTDDWAREAQQQERWRAR